MLDSIRQTSAYNDCKNFFQEVYDNKWKIIAGAIVITGLSYALSSANLWKGGSLTYSTTLNTPDGGEVSGTCTFQGGFSFSTFYTSGTAELSGDPKLTKISDICRELVQSVANETLTFDQALQESKNHGIFKLELSEKRIK